jgi:hypothetical protein
MFLNCSTCFGRHTSHHQELKNCNCSFWFYIRLWLPVAVMAQPSQRPATINYVKPQAAIIVFELLMMDGVTPGICWAFKKQWNNKFYYTVASFWFLDFKLSPCSEYCMFFLGNSPASEFYMPTFRNSLFHLNRRIGVEWLCLRNVGVFIGKKILGSKIAWASRWNTPTFLVIVILHLSACEVGTNSFPKRRNIKFGRLRITQKKVYSILLVLSIRFVVSFP